VRASVRDNTRGGSVHPPNLSVKDGGGGGGSRESIEITGGGKREENAEGCRFKKEAAVKTNARDDNSR